MPSNVKHNHSPSKKTATKIPGSDGDLEKKMFYGVARRKNKIKASKSWRVKEQNDLVPIYRAAEDKTIKALRN